jgi:hypothetical protein
MWKRISKLGLGRRCVGMVERKCGWTNMNPHPFHYPYTIRQLLKEDSDKYVINRQWQIKMLVIVGFARFKFM